MAASSSARPRDQTSDWKLYRAPRMRSGDMYVTVPTQLAAWLTLLSRCPDTCRRRAAWMSGIGGCSTAELRGLVQRGREGQLKGA